MPVIHDYAGPNRTADHDFEIIGDRGDGTFDARGIGPGVAEGHFVDAQSHGPVTGGYEVTRYNVLSIKYLKASSYKGGEPPKPVICWYGQVRATRQ
jgi:hypothetical protein